MDKPKSKQTMNTFEVRFRKKSMKKDEWFILGYASQQMAENAVKILQKRFDIEKVEIKQR